MPSSHDPALVPSILGQIRDAVKKVRKRCAAVYSVDDFLDTEEGQEKLDGICMQLVAIGESLKTVDRLTNGALFSLYEQVNWKAIKGIRDFLSHHYFDVDAEVIFDICQNHIGLLDEVLERILIDF